MTPVDLIQLSLLDAGIIGQGQTASAEDANNALRRINMMLSQWARKRWLVYALQDHSVTTTGAVYYTIGESTPASDFDIPRPDRLETGNFFRQNQGTPNAVDYPLLLLTAREDYNRITMKQMGTWPSAIFYDNAYPVGRVYAWPVPASGYELHILVKTPLTAFADLTTEINLPPEYEAAIYNNLVVRLRAAYQMAPDPIFIGLAKDSLNVLREANTQLATLQMPSAVINRRFGYNVYSDTP